jgi:hypothetical protein
MAEPLVIRSAFVAAALLYAETGQLAPDLVVMVGGRDGCGILCDTIECPRRVQCEGCDARPHEKDAPEDLAGCHWCRACVSQHNDSERYRRELRSGGHEPR